jgi:hypothetical protein
MTFNTICQTMFVTYTPPMYANSIPELERFGRDFYCAYTFRLRTPDVRDK